HRPRRRPRLLRAGARARAPPSRLRELRRGRASPRRGARRPPRADPCEQRVRARLRRDHPLRPLQELPVTDFSIRELVTARERTDVDAWGRTINPQFARVLRKIGFDREWVRAEVAYLWDKRGDRSLDMLGGFGMFNVGRNNARVRAALVEALE